MRLYSLIFVVALILCESATAGVLLGTPRGQTYSNRGTSTTALRSTNPQLGYRFRENDIDYYFNYKRAQEKYETDLFRWQKDRLAYLERQRKEKERQSTHARRNSGRSDAAARMINASASTNIHADPKEMSHDPRAWFKNKIAGSFGPRPSAVAKPAVFDAANSSANVAKQTKSSSALLDGQVAPDGADDAVKKEGLWSKFLRVLGLKK